VIARNWSSTFQNLSIDGTIKSPGKNWPQGFYKCYPQLRPRTLRPIDWACHDIYQKVVDWFPMIGRELHDPAILPENVYNMDETRNLLSSVVSRKYVIHRDDARKYRGAAVKRNVTLTIFRSGVHFVVWGCTLCIFRMYGRLLVLVRTWPCFNLLIPGSTFSWGVRDIFDSLYRIQEFHDSQKEWTSLKNNLRCRFVIAQLLFTALVWLSKQQR
jgi:hypothetical protein